MAESPILLMTVDAADLPGAAPDAELLAALAAGGWGRIVLLPPAEVDPAALVWPAGLRGRVAVRPLPGPDDAFNPDRCFAHFDGVLAGLLADGAAAATMVADYSAGTRVMGAALVLAATRHEIGTLRYVVGARRHPGERSADGGGPVHDSAAAAVTARRRTDAAWRLMAQGSFAAVPAVLDQGPQPPDDPQGWQQGARALAAFYGAWDRLDFASAAGRLAEARSAAVPPAHADLAVGPEVAEWIAALAAVDDAAEDRLRTEDRAAFATHLGRLIAELIANGRRRVAQGQFEDAAIRVYRCTELLGQCHLFRHGYDSEAMNPDEPLLATFLAHLSKRGDDRDIDTYIPKGASTPRVMLGREKVARFLMRLDDPAGRALFAFGNDPAVKARNRSLLTHGFRTIGPRQAEPLLAQFMALERMLGTLFGAEATRWLDRCGRVPGAK